VIDDCSQRGYIVVIVLFESIPVWFFAVEEISRVLAPDHKSIDGWVLIFKSERTRYATQFMPIEGHEEFLLCSYPEIVCSLKYIDEDEFGDIKRICETAELPLNDICT
jgi:hypothetical protein